MSTLWKDFSCSKLTVRGLMKWLFLKKNKSFLKNSFDQFWSRQQHLFMAVVPPVRKNISARNTYTVWIAYNVMFLDQGFQGVD